MEKIIHDFNLDFSDLPASGENRRFTITGDDGAVFSLEILNEDGYYYNFETDVFQAAKARLHHEQIVGAAYRGSVIFPSISDDDHYDIYLWVELGTDGYPNTRHVGYKEVRFADNSIDVNSSTGSNSLLLNKIIYQYTDITLTISPYSPNSTIEIGSSTSATITTSNGKAVPKQPFSITTIVNTTTKAYKIIKQPTTSDFLSYTGLTVGSAPILLLDEDQYPAASNTDTVNGVVSNSNDITMDSAVASKMVVGDRVTGFTNWNTDYSQPVTVTSLPSTNVFNTSENISVADGATLTFRNRKNYQWPVDTVAYVKEGMSLVPATNVTSGSFVSPYTVLHAQANPDDIGDIKYSSPGVVPTGTPTVTNGRVTAQAGNIILSHQQVLALAGDSIRAAGYGTEHIQFQTGYNIVLTDLKVELAGVSTTTTSLVSNSVNVPIADAGGILNGTTVSGIGIDSSSGAPTVSSGADSTDGEAIVVLSAAQTLESGATLTFSGSNTTATISGNIQIIESGSSSATLRVDIEKLLSIT